MEPEVELVIVRTGTFEFKVQEAYNALRTNLQFCGSDVQVITLTSCLPNEGKSTVSFQLATSLAEAGKHVLFIDADIRKSTLAGKFRINKEVPGLSHYLSGQNKLEEVWCKTNIENLDVILAGAVAPNPSELLGGVVFETLIETVKPEYDYLIIDSPPLGSVIDSALIAQKSNGAILVIEAGTTSYKLAQKVKEQLEKSGCRILGAILNKVEADRHGYYVKGYYGSGYGETQSEKE